MRRPTAVSICFLLFFSLLLHGQQRITPPSEEPASLSGTVTDVENGAIPAAAVTLEMVGSASRTTTRADAEGSFTFTDLPPGTYRVIVTAPNFSPRTTSPLPLQPGEHRDLGNLVLNIAVVQTTVTAVTLDQLATEQVHVQEQQRVVGFFPNFYVTYVPHPAPLTAGLKFRLALRVMVDPVTFLGSAVFAGFDQAADTPDYRQGAVGYAQRFGADYADGFTNILIGGAILPSLLHQDPRYFYQGTGTVRSRILHAAAFAVLSKGDNGHWQANYSGIGGDLASGAISDLYYPASNRSASLVFENALLGAAGRVANDLAQEFVFKKFTTRHK